MILSHIIWWYEVDKSRQSGRDAGRLRPDVARLARIRGTAPRPHLGRRSPLLRRGQVGRSVAGGGDYRCLRPRQQQRPEGRPGTTEDVAGIVLYGAGLALRDPQ